MRAYSRYSAIALIVFLSIGIFAFAGCLQAAENDKAIKEGQKAIIEGANQMMQGNKKIMAIMAEKGMKDAELTAAEKMMTDGYDLVTKGEAMMTAGTTAEGQEMMKRGSKLMLDAQKETAAVVEKKGMTQGCATDLRECASAEEKIQKGRSYWQFGY